MWFKLIRSSFPPYLCSFLAGVLVSTGINLFTGVALTERPTVTPQIVYVIIGAISFLLASAGAAFLAWRIDDVHQKWLRQGSPTDQTHVERIVKPFRRTTIISLIVTIVVALAGCSQIAAAILSKG